MAEIEVKYGGVQIVYEERQDKWVFTLRGRERSAESLSKAKEAIDKPEPKKDKKGFQPTEAYMISYGDNPKKVKITSIAEASGWSSADYVWVTIDGTRRKERAHIMYPCSPDNNAAVARLLTIQAEREKLSDEARTLVKNMKPIELPKEA